MPRSLHPSLSLLFALASACGPAAAPPSAAPAPEPSAQASPPPAAPMPTSAATREQETTCGALDCQLFDTPLAAFERVLAEKPLVIGIGEAHAQKGTEHLKSTAARFGQDFLPVAAEGASDIVLELMQPDASCIKTTEQAKEKGKEVTEGQAQTNQGEYLALGNRANEAGLRPHILRPSCEEYQRIVDAGPDFVLAFMETIAMLTDTLTKAILERNHKQGVDKLVLLYGGALHNDSVPREGRERWSYGPSLLDYTKGRYLEVDLVVREYIKDAPPWDKLVWYPHFDRNAHPDRAVLYRPSEHSFVLIFPASQQPAGR